MIRKLTSVFRRNYTTKEVVSTPKETVKLVQKGGMWKFKVKPVGEKPKKSDFSFLSRISSAVLFVFGGLYTLNLFSATSGEVHDASFEETSALKMTRAWNSLLRNFGNVMVEQINLAEQRRQESIPDLIKNEAESLNYQVVEIKEIKHE